VTQAASPVTADVVEAAQHAVGVADDEIGVVARLDQQIVARLGQLAAVAGEEPAAQPDALEVEAGSLGVAGAGPRGGGAGPGPTPSPPPAVSSSVPAVVVSISATPSPSVRRRYEPIHRRSTGGSRPPSAADASPSRYASASSSLPNRPGWSSTCVSP